MADKVNKKDALRKLLATDPDISFADAEGKLKAMGAEMSSNTFANYKSDIKGGSGKNGKKKAKATAAPAAVKDPVQETKTAGTTISDVLVQAQKLADDVGGKDELKRILDMLK